MVTSIGSSLFLWHHYTPCRSLCSSQMDCRAVLWTYQMLSCLRDFSCTLLAVWNCPVPESCKFRFFISFRFFLKYYFLVRPSPITLSQLQPSYISYPLFHPSTDYHLTHSLTNHTITRHISYGIFIWLYHVQIPLPRTWYLAHSGFLINIEWMNECMTEW